MATFSKGLAAEFLERMKVFGEKFDRSVYYDPESSAHTKRAKTVHGYGVEFLADLNFGPICANGVRLKRKPHVFVRGSSEPWRYQTKKSDCQDGGRRAECTKGKRPRMLCVNVYREDLQIHAARMKTDEDLTNHQGVRHARWKGLARARLQAGLAIILLHTLKWHKIREGQLIPMTLKPAA